MKSTSLDQAQELQTMKAENQQALSQLQASTESEGCGGCGGCGGCNMPGSIGGCLKICTCGGGIQGPPGPPGPPGGLGSGVCPTPLEVLVEPINYTVNNQDYPASISNPEALLKGFDHTKGNGNNNFTW